MMNKYWSAEEAAVDLAHALDTVKALKAEALRYGHKSPAWHQADVKYAVGRVRDAVRYLRSDESGDPDD